MEGQLTDELSRMAAAASHPSLKNILMHHREETQVQRQRPESILQKHGANPRAHTDQAMQALVNETEMMLGMEMASGRFQRTSFIRSVSSSARQTADQNPRRNQICRLKASRLETLARLEGLEEPARIRQALDGSRLLLVPKEPPVWRRASRPPSSSQQSSLLLLSL